MEQVKALSEAQKDRAARNDLIQRTLRPLQQEIDKISMLLLGVEDSEHAQANNKEKAS